MGADRRIDTPLTTTRVRCLVFPQQAAYLSSPLTGTDMADSTRSDSDRSRSKRSRASDAQTRDQDDKARRQNDEPQDDPESGFSLSGDEQGDVEENRPPRAAVLHEIIRREGEHELSRGIPALIWSSVAAGLTMGFSMLARGVLHRHVGSLPGGFLLESFGYTFGFLTVMIARQQLFTENTLTAVLPIMTKPSLSMIGCLLRMWSVVLVGNLIGVALFAWGLLHMQQFDAQTDASFRFLGREVMHNSVLQMFTKGILAGWIIAMMVWMTAATQQSRLAIIIICTYVIALSGFTHIIVGSAETLYLVFDGLLSFSNYATRFALPTLAGNIVGGSLIFALISHAQVRSDSEN